MVETVLSYGRFDKVALQDSILQVLKRCERLLHRKSYERLFEESSAFHREEKNYSSYPALTDGASVLIFKPDDIGDAIYSLPALFEFRKKYPRVRLYLLCQEKTRELYERTNLFEQVVEVRVTTRWLRFQSMDLESALDKFPTDSFDLAVFLRTYPAYFRYFKKIRASQKVLPKDPRLKLRAGFSAWVTPLSHQSKQMFEILERVSSIVEETDQFPVFHWTSADTGVLRKVFGTGQPKPYIVAHPHARFETRRYPYEYWRTLLAEIHEKTKMQIVLIGGKDDPALEIPGALQTQGRLSLTETGYLMAKSSAFIGNESGPGHWASVLGIPTAMIFSGHSHLSEWGPLGKHLILKKDVPCQNCYLRACPRYKVRCLTEIKPEVIREEILSFLHKNEKSS